MPAELIGLSFFPHGDADHISVADAGGPDAVAQILEEETIPAYGSGLDLSRFWVLPVYVRDGFVWTGPLPDEDLAAS